MGDSPAYRRIMLKLSGEALMGRQDFGIDDPQFGRDLGERGVFDERGSQATQVAFRRVRACMEQRVGNDEVEDRIAEILQPLVVTARGTAMRQRLP